MTPVEQRKPGGPPDGDCFAACMASIFEVSLDGLPAIESATWWDDWLAWLAPRGLSLVHIGIEGCPMVYGYAILHVESPRYPGELHAVVAKDGVIVWDPSPKRDQGVGVWRGWTIVTVLEPSRQREAREP